MGAVTAVFTLFIWADSEDYDQMPQEEVGDQGLHSLTLVQQSSDTSTCSKMVLFKYQDKYGKK